MPTDDDLMRAAIGIARRNPDAPFGAVVYHAVHGVIAEGLNAAAANPTLHGEIDAINNAVTFGWPARDGFRWSDCTLVTTAEPCPMCMAAIVWAGIGRVVYGTSVPTLKRLGWWQFDLRAADVLAAAPGKRCELVGGVREAECGMLFDRRHK